MERNNLIIEKLISSKPISTIVRAKQSNFKCPIFNNYNNKISDNSFSQINLFGSIRDI